MPLSECFRLFLQKIAQRAEIEVQVGGSEPEMRGKFVDLGLQRHQRLTHVFDLLFSQRATLHPAYCLSLEKAAQQFNHTKRGFRQYLVNVLRRKVDSGFV